MKYSFFFLLISFLFVTTSQSALAQEQAFSLKPQGSLTDISLKPGYAYGYFHANRDYLIWYEINTHKLFIYNLHKQRLNKVLIKKGRGPHEALVITELFINHDNVIYLLANRNIKLIRVTVTGKFLNDKIFEEGFRPLRILQEDKYQIFMDANNQKALYFLKQDNSYLPLGKEEINVSQTHNYFKKLGPATIKNDYLVQERKYQGDLYIYDLKSKSLTKKIHFDNAGTVWSEIKKSDNGVKRILPPKKADFVGQDIARIPGAPHRIFLLIKGVSDKRNYGLDKVFEYDFEKEKFFTTHQLDVKVNEITVNNNYLFAYSKDKNKIYRYKIVHKQ